MDQQSKNSDKVVYLVEYDDAAFSYEDFSPTSLIQLNTVKSTGWIRGQNENYIDLGIERVENNNEVKYLKGILIPNKAVRKITKLYEK